MECRAAPKQAHAGEQPENPEIMIAMQMRDKCMIHMSPADTVLLHFDLRAFPAINQDILPIKAHHLCRRVAAVGRECGVVSEDCDFHKREY